MHFTIDDMNKSSETSHTFVSPNILFVLLTER